MLESSDNVITKGIAEKAKTYLDWLETVFLSDDRMKSLVQLFEHPKMKIVEPKMKKQNRRISN